MAARKLELQLGLCASGLDRHSQEGNILGMNLEDKEALLEGGLVVVDIGQLP